jgi:hypothetical protein
MAHFLTANQDREMIEANPSTGVAAPRGGRPEVAG